jgi:uncharacterized protein (DUF433 family)
LLRSIARRAWEAVARGGPQCFETPSSTAGGAVNYGMASVTEIGTLIDRDPRIRGGRPKIAGTGLTVSRIAGWYKMGMTPEEIALEYPHLTLAQVHAALSYYHVNRDEIEADLAQEEAAALQLEHQFGTKANRH